jgi:hypothetical protein
MGIGFALLFGLILGVIVAGCASAALGFLAGKFLKNSPERPRRRAIIATRILPPIAMVIALCGFVGYGIWCETARGLDAGLGDSWCVPLGLGYSLQMIDIPQNAYVQMPTGNQVGVKRLGYDDRFLYIETAPDKYFLIDKKTGALIHDLTTQALDKQLKESGAPPAILRSPDEVYRTLRWGIEDIVAGLLILALPAFLTLVVLLYVIKVRWSSRSVVEYGDR